MAWAEQLKNGKFRGCYRDSAAKKRYVRDSNGNVVHYERKRDAKFAASEKENDARRAAPSKETVIAASTTWGEWWDQIAPSRRNPHSDAHLVEAEGVEAYIRPKWGHVALTKITHQGAQDWVTDELSPGKKPDYVRRIWAAFSMSIRIAVDKGILTANPCAGVKLPKRRKGKKPFMTPEYLETIELPQAYEDAVSFQYESGFRPGELCGMHADQLDLEGGWVWATNVMLYRTKRIRPWPKDEDARRVPLTPKAIEAAKHALEGRNLTAGCGVPHTDGSKCASVLVFLTPTGKALRPRSWGEMLRVAAKKAGVPNRSPYAARRGFATWAAAGGMDAFALAELMGHGDVEDTRGYVQQSPAVRARLLAARGVHEPLKAVSDGGADGAGGGADHEPQSSSATLKRGDESVG